MIRALSLFFLNYAAMVNLQPGVPHAELAIANTVAMLETEPLFEDDKLEVAVVVGAEFEESSFRARVVGDGGRSCGALQVWNGCRLTVLESLISGIEQIRLSFSMSKNCEWCGYLGGPHGIESSRVRRMSLHRERAIARLLADLSTDEGLAQR